RYLFGSWSDGGAQSHVVTTPGTAATFTATFVPQFLLTTAVSPAGGGTVTPNPLAPGLDGYYNNGTVVQLAASPTSGQQFSSWSGDASGSSNPTSVTMNAPRNVTANFSSGTQGITVTTNPSGLSITVDGATLTAPQTFQWTPGSSHTIGVAGQQ